MKYLSWLGSTCDWGPRLHARACLQGMTHVPTFCPAALGPSPQLQVTLVSQWRHPSSPLRWIQDSVEQLAPPTRALPPSHAPCAVPIPCRDCAQRRVAAGVLSPLPKSSPRPLPCSLSSAALSPVSARHPSPHPEHVAQVTLHLG